MRQETERERAGELGALEQMRLWLSVLNQLCVSDFSQEEKETKRAFALAGLSRSFEQLERRW